MRTVRVADCCGRCVSLTGKSRQLVVAAIAEEGDPVATTFAVHQTEDPARPFVVTAEKEKELLNAMAANDVVFLGEHHNKASDHALQAKIISGIAERRGTGNVAVGLEMVQQQFQSALDKYIGREIAEDAAAERALYDGVEWAERWQWSFEDYLPVFRLAREKSIPLIALNVDSDAMARVRFGGLESLTQAERDLYVQDKKGFIAFSKTPGFIDYVEKIIMPSYSLHARMGLLGKNPSQANFYSSRILWDEGMSTLAYRFLRKTEAAPPEQKQMMVVLEGADHVKFSMGSVGRMKRMAPALKVASVLLNPTPVDTRLDSAQGDGEAPLAISFAYGGQVVTDRDGVIKERVKGVVGVADYLWFSSPPTLGLLPAGLRSLA